MIARRTKAFPIFSHAFCAVFLLKRFVRSAASTLSFLLLFGIVAFAQSATESAVKNSGATLDRRQNEPGRFDFYVLALSWSPSFCAAAAERAHNRPTDPQCGGRPYSFVVHGLWPQYERGYPSFCQVPAPRLNRAIVAANLDMMPSPRLIFHEWDRHGTCSGLSPNRFFDVVRKARGVVKIPPYFLDLSKPIAVSPGDVVKAFLDANPGLPRDALTIACDSKRLNEVRVCLNKDLSFRHCADLSRRSCKRGKIAMPAVRGG
jgi:ribonuclease T2